MNLKMLPNPAFLSVKYSSKYQGNYRPISLIQKYQKKGEKTQT